MTGGKLIGMFVMMKTFTDAFSYIVGHDKVLHFYFFIFLLFMYFFMCAHNIFAYFHISCFFIIIHDDFPEPKMGRKKLKLLTTKLLNK